MLSRYAGRIFFSTTKVAKVSLLKEANFKLPDNQTIKGLISRRYIFYSNINWLLDSTKHTFDVNRQPCRCESSPSRALNNETTVEVAKCGISKNLKPKQSEHKNISVFGEDACFSVKYGDTYIVGVADGVGGWNEHGIDPSKFSSMLLSECQEIVMAGEFEASRPDLIIKLAYERLVKTPTPPIGYLTRLFIKLRRDFCFHIINNLHFGH